MRKRINVFAILIIALLMITSIFTIGSGNFLINEDLTGQDSETAETCVENPDKLLSDDLNFSDNHPIKTPIDQIISVEKYVKSD